jgi:hypothetical protein
MGTPLSPYQECHPFLPSSLAYDLVVSSVQLIGLFVVLFLIYQQFLQKNLCWWKIPGGMRFEGISVRLFHQSMENFSVTTIGKISG